MPPVCGILEARTRGEGEVVYEERPSHIDGAVVWTRKVTDAGPYRVLPDGCTDLILSGGQLLAAGPDTRAQLGRNVPGIHYTGLRFAPGTGPSVLGVPAHELRDRRVPLADLWGAHRARLLTERVAEAGDAGAALEAVARDRLADVPPPARHLAAVVAGLRRGRTVADVAAEAGLGERQLHRQSLAAFGYGPKTLARVLRLGRALDLARAGMPYAQVAVVAGYADQAHLAREVKTLTGEPLTALLAG